MHKILDTSILIHHWHQALQRARTSPSANRTGEQTVRSWARDLARVRQSKAILTPIYIEFMAGAKSAKDIRLFRSYLSEFVILDDGKVFKTDWDVALQIAERVPPDGKPRQLGDCLIRALARRLNCEVVSKDVAFPK
jgi:predicted nucleic acid-binding protein